MTAETPGFTPAGEVELDLYELLERADFMALSEAEEAIAKQDRTTLGDYVADVSCALASLSKIFSVRKDERTRCLAFLTDAAGIVASLSLLLTNKDSKQPKLIFMSRKGRPNVHPGGALKSSRAIRANNAIISRNAAEVAEFLTQLTLDLKWLNCIRTAKNTPSAQRRLSRLRGAAPVLGTLARVLHAPVRDETRLRLVFNKRGTPKKSSMLEGRWKIMMKKQALDEAMQRPGSTIESAAAELSAPSKRLWGRQFTMSRSELMRLWKEMKSDGFYWESIARRR